MEIHSSIVQQFHHLILLILLTRVTGGPTLDKYTKHLMQKGAKLDQIAIMCKLKCLTQYSTVEVCIRASFSHISKTIMALKSVTDPRNRIHPVLFTTVNWFGLVLV